MARPMPRLPPVTIAVLPENIGKGFYRGVPLSEKLILAVRMTGRLGHSNMWVRTSNGVRASTAAAVSIGGPEMTFTLSTVPSAVTVASRMTTPSTTSSSCLRRIIWLLNVNDLRLLDIAADSNGRGRRWRRRHSPAEQTRTGAGRKTRVDGASERAERYCQNR